MLPNFLVQETTVRESGESQVVSLENATDRNILLTLGITHAMEEESLDVNIHASEDGQKWSSAPVATFTRKYYCGTYQLLLSAGHNAKFVKVSWKVNRWGKGEDRPFFRFYLFAQEARARAAGAA